MALGLWLLAMVYPQKSEVNGQQPKKKTQLYELHFYKLKFNKHGTHFFTIHSSWSRVWCRLLGSHSENRFWTGIRHFAAQCRHRIDRSALFKEN